MGKRGPRPGDYKEPIIKTHVRRPNPLPGMPPGARTVWKRIVASMPENYFQPQHYDTLRSFCVASFRLNKAVFQIEKLEEAMEQIPGSEEMTVVEAAKLRTGMLEELKYWRGTKTAEANVITAAGTKLGIHKNSTWSNRNGEQEPQKPKSRRGDLLSLPDRRQA